MKTKLLTFALGGCALLALAANQEASAKEVKLPPGYDQVVLSTGFINGTTQTTACAGLAATHYPDRDYKLLAATEEMKYRVPELRIDARYNYTCTLLLGPKD